MDELTGKPAHITPLGRSATSRDDLERWLVEDVVPVYDAMQADPGRAVPAERVSAALDAAHAEWVKNAARDA